MGLVELHEDLIPQTCVYAIGVLTSLEDNYEAVPPSPQVTDARYSYISPSIPMLAKVAQDRSPKHIKCLGSSPV